MLFPIDMRLPTLDTFASAVKRAISAFCNAVATAKSELEVFFFGSSISVSVSAKSGRSSPTAAPARTRRRQRTAPNVLSSFVSIPLAGTLAKTTTTTTTTITLTTATSSTVFTTNGVFASITHETTVLPTGFSWTKEGTASVAASVAALCANSASASASASAGMSSLTRSLPKIQALLAQVKWPRYPQRVGSFQFIPDEDETEGEFVVFGLPRTFHYHPEKSPAVETIKHRGPASSSRRVHC